MSQHDSNDWLRKWTLIGGLLLAVSVLMPVLTLSGTELKIHGFWSFFSTSSVGRIGVSMVAVLTLFLPILFWATLRGKVLGASVLVYCISYFLFLEQPLNTFAAPGDDYLKVIHSVLDNFYFFSTGSGVTSPFLFFLFGIGTGNYLSSLFSSHRFPYVICGLSASLLGLFMLTAMLINWTNTPGLFTTALVFESMVRQAPFYVTLLFTVLLCFMAAAHALFTTMHGIVRDFFRIYIIVVPIFTVFFHHTPSSILEGLLLAFLVIKLLSALYGSYFMLDAGFSAVIEMNSTFSEPQFPPQFNDHPLDDTTDIQPRQRREKPPTDFEDTVIL